MKREAGGIAGMVLAAGRSSRMGSFKPLLPLGKSTVIESAVGGLLAAGIGNVTVVVGWRAEELLPLLERLGVRAVLNQNHHLGMYSSVMAGVRSLDPHIHAFLLLPADVPMVKPRTVAELVQRFVEGEASVVYPSFLRRRGHPPVISVRCLAEAPPSDPPGGLRSVLSRYEDTSVDVEVADPGTIMDMDTPSDYLALVDYYSRGHSPTLEECEAILGILRIPPPV